MVFVDKIENTIRLERYLPFRLPNYICNKKQAFVIIQLITSNLDTNTKTKVMKDLGYKITRIYIYMKCTSISTH